MDAAMAPLTTIRKSRTTRHTAGTPPAGARIAPESFDNYRQHLTDLLEAHATLTGSAWSTRILDEFRDFVGKFWLVKPKAASLEALANELRRAA